jgi:hypothetical protein
MGLRYDVVDHEIPPPSSRLGPGREVDTWYSDELGVLCWDMVYLSFPHRRQGSHRSLGSAHTPKYDIARQGEGPKGIQ